MTEQRDKTSDAAGSYLSAVVSNLFNDFDQGFEKTTPKLYTRELGMVNYVGAGIARIEGLPGVGSEELVRFQGDLLGMVFNLDPAEIGVVLLDDPRGVQAGGTVRRTGRVLDAPVGEGLLGRVVDAVGRPLDGRGPITAVHRRRVEQPAPGILDRAPVNEPLHTGIKAVDALIPIGRGQRELILGDRQIGKTAIAVDTILNQRGGDVLCIYCAIGQRSDSVAKVVSELRRHDALDQCIVVVATGEDPPGLQFVAPFAAMTMAEYFMERGEDALVVFDDLTHHARAYRELSLLLRRPPGREAFPGDIFYLHARLLERATRLREELGGGSVTAMPIVETQAQNISAYIPTNLISITDGQIYLSPNLFHKGVLPAIDVGKSVSRVGGKAQLAAYRSVAGDLRLSYSQFEELETFARFGARLDEETRSTIEHGRRVREILKQPQYESLSVGEQIAVLLAVNTTILDTLPLKRVRAAENSICEAVKDRAGDVVARITNGESLSEDDRRVLMSLIEDALAEYRS